MDTNKRPSKAESKETKALSDETEDQGREGEAAQAAPKMWKISRHTNSKLTNAEADTIITEGMKLLRDVDGPDDVSCPIEIRRDGDVGTFSVGNGIINTTADWLAVCRTGGRVHIVNQINICGGTPSPNIVGCSSFNGDCMVVVRYPAAEPNLWMHEYGHNQGNDDDYTRNKAVMYYQVGSDHRRVNQDECNHYQQTERMLAAALRQAPPLVKDMDIREFVRQIYIHGVPEKQARQFSASDIPVLLEMLADQKEEQYWSNIVVTLGFIGDPQAVKPLIEFLLDGEGTLTRDQYDAKSAVLVSLGNLINKTGSLALQTERGLHFLQEGLNPEAWAEQVKWINPYGLNAEEQKIQLTKMAVWGLAVSGEPEAGNALRALQLRLLSSDLDELLIEALACYAKVSKEPKAAVGELSQIDSLANATDKVLDKVLARVIRQDARQTDPGQTRLFFPDGIELIDVDFGLEGDLSKPKFSVKVHVRGPSAKPGVVESDEVDEQP
jgi:hypothetical protein